MGPAPSAVRMSCDVIAEAGCLAARKLQWIAMRRDGSTGMAFFRFQYVNDLSAILVGAMFNAIPMLIIFFIFSKYYMQGASYTGLAGQ
jgi:hypothetical protein